jgi:hypothetical protein
MESNALENWSSTLQLWKIGVQRFSFGELESNALALEIGVQRFSFGELEFNALALEIGVQRFSFGRFLFFGINVMYWWAKKLVQRPTSLNLLLENRNMETIQIPVTSELAQQLRFYQDELPRLLELGLRLIKTENIKQIQTETAYLGTVIK